MSARIILGVCGGIAAYKAASLCSRLVQREDIVDVILTADAQHFVGEATFAALARRPVWTSLWQSAHDIPHIRLVREADVLVIAPATANVIAKLALGLADDLLTNAALAARIPIVIAPAMNSAMLDHPATRMNLATLAARGVHIVEPGVGFLAERETGPGRLADEAAILAAIDAAVTNHRNGEQQSNAPVQSVAGSATPSLSGETVLITAGPTREAIDPVRFLSNAASGAMGIELAREAHRRGARVQLILGPTALAVPEGGETVRVTTAREMARAAFERAQAATIIIATAAVADYEPAYPSTQKIKKQAGGQTLELVRTPDILAELGSRKRDQFLVGFAAETDDHEANARQKMRTKHLDAIAVNDVSNENGFGPVDNQLTVLTPGGERHELGPASKAVLAGLLLDVISTLRARS